VPARRALPFFGLFFLLGLGIGLACLAVFGVNEIFRHHTIWPGEDAFADYAKGRTLAGQMAPATPAAVLNNPRAVEAGRAAFVGSCAVCHGATGKGDGPLGKDLFPAPPDLRTPAVRARSDGELFAVVHDGLSFAGMPSFAKEFNDADTWSLVAYIRALQKADNPDSLAAELIPTPLPTQLAGVDPHGTPPQRGAAIYFAQGCQFCHGPQGDAPGELALRGGGREAQTAIRTGRRGMPVYGPEQISDAQLTDLIAYLNTFPGGGPGPREGGFPGRPPGGGPGGGPGAPGRPGGVGGDSGSR
jgi:mono/diheme cytochrome c family protein